MRAPARFAALCAAFLLAGCATSDNTVHVTRSRYRAPVIIDGLDVNAINQTLVHGFSQIKERAIEDPDIDQLFTAALGGLTRIDPEITIAVADGHIKIRRAADAKGGEVDVADAGAAPSAGPNKGNIAAWSKATLIAILAARRSSTLMHAAGEEEFFNAIFTSALTKTDAFSHYSPRQDAVRTRLVRDGVIGLGIRMVNAPEGALVQAMVTDGPADKAGININDVIIAADDRPLAKMGLTEMRRLLDGSTDTLVSLTVKHPGQTEPVTVLAKRELIVPDTVVSKSAAGVAELHVRSFNQRTAAAVERSINNAREANGAPLKGIIIDFRGDPGGLLDQAVDMSDLFLDGGAITSLTGRHPGAKQYYAAHGHDMAPGVPIVVIVDGRTASAAEIVAAALQDNGRAVVVGTGSLGKGSVQTVVRLLNGGEIALTWAHATTPRGASLHGLGVLPDVCLAGFPNSAEAQARIGALPTPEDRRRWRMPHDDEASHESLREACPAEAHLDRDVELEVAHKLLADPVMMAKVTTPAASQLADKP